MWGNGEEIVGIWGAGGGFIVVDIKCGLISIHPPPAKIFRVARDMVGFDGYGFGGVVVGVVDGDGMIWWRLYGNDRNDGIFAGND